MQLSESHHCRIAENSKAQTCPNPNDLAIQPPLHLVLCVYLDLRAMCRVLRFEV
ncbi:UNVERIFIED_ORG: hypothetical protein ABIC54_006407 [Burkholderia sp. 1263]